MQAILLLAFLSSLVSAFDYTVGVGRAKNAQLPEIPSFSNFEVEHIALSVSRKFSLRKCCLDFESSQLVSAEIETTYDNPCTPLEGGFNSGVITVADNLEVDAPGLPQVRLLVNSTEPLWFFDQAGGLCREGAVLSANPTSTQTAGGFVENASRAPASPPPSSSTSSDSPSSSTGSTSTSTGEAAPAQSSGSNTGYRDAVSGATVLFGLVIGLL
ncbi:hypothetical protein CCMSSC00406_0003548 [Pleurotus cornucopiae]|uniref:Uncharacterized protein n=1 Tax=Pleurotus cornucopiae TaxID=5321 RepID=A0ACB7IHM0_PLECO|nr:hypothetical protein CCMSSC00406_0003548 [Pleurotus cornucopiae]